ncbi:RluA family pseudouridine synthase [Buchnera aphidicola (Mollitrichosiphum nigrofasciatum)]|uniref:RluA family pseudouridine synthase n=1 Tax=Buchnera aphidicola TaxID=9 RepID=UPI0031B85DE2
MIKIVPKKIFFKKRLDQVLVYLFNEYSRSFLKNLIVKKCVFVDDRISYSPNKRIFGGEIIRLCFYTNIKHLSHASDFFLNIVYEDQTILIINKSYDMVTHPSPGHINYTLLNVLRFKYKYLKYIPRAGIVHRLDKNTTGLIIIAKNLFTYLYFKNLFIRRKICREYIIFAIGKLVSGGIIKKPIGRDRFKRILMSVNGLNNKNATTHFRIIKKFNCHTYLRVFLETGRTHQIRVHFLHINYPVFGDKLYNKKNLYLKGFNLNCRNTLSLFPRQAMHAQTLRFFNPITRQLMYISSSIPADMKILKFYLERCI